MVASQVLLLTHPRGGRGLLIATGRRLGSVVSATPPKNISDSLACARQCCSLAGERPARPAGYGR
jgi:hypothetical protein